MKKVTVERIRLITNPRKKKEAKDVIQKSIKLFILLIGCFEDNTIEVFTLDSENGNRDLLDIDRFVRYRSFPVDSIRVVDIKIPQELYDHIEQKRKQLRLSWQEILIVCQFLLFRYSNGIFIEKNGDIRQIIVD